MLNILSRKARGVSLEIDQENGRRGPRYVIFADGQPIDEATTIIKAKRKANAFAGETVFSLSEAYVHAH